MSGDDGGKSVNRGSLVACIGVGYSSSLHGATGSAGVDKP